MLSVIEFSDDELEVSLKMLILIKTSKQANKQHTIQRKKWTVSCPTSNFSLTRGLG